MQIDLTWNLFLTPLLITTLGFFVKKWINDVEKKADERSAEFKTDVLAIRTCVAEMKKEMIHKLDKDEYMKYSDEKWNRIYNHEHEIDCDGEDCTARRTCGVVIPGGRV